MTELPDVVIKRIFEKLDGIEAILHDQWKRISRVEAANRLVESIWKKIIAVVGISSGIIGILVVLK